MLVVVWVVGMGVWGIWVVVVCCWGGLIVVVSVLVVWSGLLGRVKVVGRFIIALDLGTKGTFTLGKLFDSRYVFRASSYESGTSVLYTWVRRMHVKMLCEESAEKMLVSFSCGLLILFLLMVVLLVLLLAVSAL